MIRLPWIRMNNLIHAEADKVALRFTKGDSDWLDKSNRKYKLVVKKNPWEDLNDLTDALITQDGVFPNEAIWNGENNEPGRIVFDLSAEQTAVNPKKHRYYARVIEYDADDTVIRSVFAGYFKVIYDGDKHVKEENVE